MILQRVSPERLHDCQRIKQILWDRGIDERLVTCRGLWESISYLTYKTEWYILPENDEEVYRIIAENTTVLD
jgi:hypothetical protein